MIQTEHRKPESDSGTISNVLHRKREIAFGRIKGGDKLPTIAEMSKETGLSFSKSRGVMERLEREGYAHPRPRVGTLAVSHGENVLRGRVLVAMPDVDSGRFFTSHMINILRREIINAGYEFAVVTFPLDENENLFFSSASSCAPPTS